MRARCLTPLLFAACVSATALHGATPSISAGGSHSLALHADGTVRAWGDDYSGQLGLGRAFYSNVPVSVQALADVIAVSAGGSHGLALKRDGTVMAWGDNFYGALGDGSNRSRSAPVAVAGLTGVIAIAAAEFHSVALRSDGSVWSWGGNDFGQLGNGAAGGNTDVPAPVGGLAGIVAISAGARHTLALRNDGGLHAWGRNEAGQLGDGTRIDRASPVPVGGINGVAAVSGGGAHTIARRSDGSVWAWGGNAEGQLGDATMVDRTSPVAVVGLGTVTSAFAGGGHSIALKSDGSVWTWGSSRLSQITDRTRPTQVNGLGAVALVAAGGGQSFALASGGVFAWGHNSEGQLGDGTFVSWPMPVPVSAFAGVTALSTGGSLTLGLQSDGRVLAAGANTAGQLGNGTRLFRSTPAVVPGLNGVVAVTAGGAHSFAVKGDGTAWAWGGNDYGQLGIGGGGYQSSPVQVAGLSGAVAIATGEIHSAALKSDGSVAAWGFNGFGQVGDGTTIDRFAPVPVIGLSGVTAIAVGTNHTMALRSDGRVSAWGRNNNGQLGDGTTTDRATPVLVSGLTGVIAISAGNFYSAALKGDGTVWMWGMNGTGLLGDVPPGDRLTPVQVPGLTGVVAIAAAYYHLAALKSDRTLVAVGWNDRGQLGDGSTDDRSTPVPVGLAGVTAVSAQNIHTLAMREDATLFGWGDNQSGQVGDGTLANRAAPTVVLREDGAGSVAANNWFLDLNPALGKNIPPERIPLFPVVVSGSTPADVTANIQYRAQDVGSSASIYVFALAPANVVLAAKGGEPALAVGYAKRRGDKDTRDTSVACVLAQLNASGQLQAVSASSLQAYVTGVLTAQGAAVTIINGVPTATIGGATFYVGYGGSGNAMLTGGTNRSVVSVPAARECKPQPPQTGWWWNKSEGGRGYSIEVQGNHIFYAAFLYDDAGRSNWFVATGTTSLDGSLFTGDLLRVANGQTLGGAYQAPTPAQSVGPFTLAFSGASNGTMVWPGGTVAIERFNIVPNGLNAAPRANQPETGWWWNPAESGRGFFIEWQDGEADLAGYMYDDAGNAVWYLSVFPTPDIRAFTGSWWLYANGQSLTGAYKPATRINANVAPVTIQFTSATTATMTLPGGRTTALQRHRF